MKLEVLKYIHDIYECCEVLQEYAAPIEVSQDIDSNKMLKDAIERRLSIVGEALYQANKLDKELPISDKTKIIALRHIIVHDYDKVNTAGILLILKKHVPVLKTEVKEIIDKFPPEENVSLEI